MRCSKTRVHRGETCLAVKGVGVMSGSVRRVSLEVRYCGAGVGDRFGRR